MAHQTNYLHVEKLIYFSQTVFNWSSLLWKSREDYYRPKLFTSFFTLSETNRHTNCQKYGSCKKPFLQCLCYWHNLLRLILFFPCGNWKTFLIKDDRYPEVLFNPHILVFFGTSYSEDDCIYFLSPQYTKVGNTKVPEWSSHISNFYIMIFWSNFVFWCTTFFFMNEKCLKHLKHLWRHFLTQIIVFANSL